MQKNILKKILSIVLVVMIMLQIYLIAEPAIAVDDTDGVVVTLTVDTGITISDGANVTMSPNIGIASDGSIGTSSWIVRTNNSTAPALKSGVNTFEDYTESSLGTPEVWNVTAGGKEFGFSAYGANTSTGTWGTSANCGAGGVPAVDQKYVGFSTTDKVIASNSSVTSTAGVNTNICFAAEQDTVYAPSGVYTATITATATTL
jgi:hypothetical protein